MSDRITLALKSPLGSRLEAECIVPDRFAGLSEREIAALPVWQGRIAAQLGDFFNVTGARSGSVLVEGELTHVDGLGSAMTGGELLVAGDAGNRVGVRMAGGFLEVRGSVGDEAGIGMAGGTLRIRGDAGDRLGGACPGASRGVTGGEIVVDGSAGSHVAVRCRRGLLVVGHDTGEFPAQSMIAGTLVVFGRVGAGPGRGNKRGSLLAAGSIDVPATYRYASTFEPPFVRLVMTYLKRRFDLAIAENVVEGPYRRYVGDAGPPGRGEILERLPLLPQF